MAGIYGRIDSHAEFQQTLQKALATALHGRAVQPHSPVTINVARQLEAMRQWTANGRSPTEDEQSQIDVGLVASRELSDTGRQETEEWAQELRELDNFFQGWPTDQEAASSTGSDAEALELIRKAGDRKLRARKQRSP
ncbi:MAG: hypothetical protein RL701_691 [Pseudomonadota bacterium]|jgi:hypothetical protein